MAATARGSLQVDDRSADWWREGALDGRPVVALAHGAGADMASPFMQTLATGLVDSGLAVVRFRFPYMQQRVDTGSRRPPDRAPRLLDTWRALLDTLASWKGAGPVVLAGKSMGGRMASMLLAEGRAPEARAAVYLGYPLHPPGQSDRLRSEHLSDVAVPQLFVSGTRDRLAERPLLERVVDGLDDARLLLVEGGDHSLERLSRDQAAGPGVDWTAAMESFVRMVCEGC